MVVSGHLFSVEEEREVAMKEAVGIDEPDLQIGMGRYRCSHSLVYGGSRHLDEVEIVRVLPQHLG